MNHGAPFRHVSLKVPIKIHKAIRIWGLRQGLLAKEAYQAALQEFYKSISQKTASKRSSKASTDTEDSEPQPPVEHRARSNDSQGTGSGSL